jgi:hypothetical protein
VRQEKDRDAVIAALELIWLVGACSIFVTMIPTLVQCVADVFAPLYGTFDATDRWNRRASFLWIILLLLIAVLWPIALVFLFFEWRSSR